MKILHTGWFGLALCGCLGMHQASLASLPGGGEPFDGCGTLQVGPQGCPLFVSGGAGYLLPSIDGFTYGDTIWVTGTIQQDSLLCLPVQWPGIPDAELRSCFAGCGTLAIGPQGCVVLNTGTETYAVQNLDGFGPGDEVFVSGPVNVDSLACFPATIPEIENVTIGQCFEEVGTLTVGPQTCAAILTDSGEFAVLENTGNFGFGDCIFVRGAFNPESQLCLPVVVPGVEGNTIEACFDQCGELNVGPQGCIVLNADDGFSYAVENIGTFMVGDRVRVRGVLNAFSQACFPAQVPGVEHNSIDVCAEGPDLNGDGTVDATDLAILLGMWGPCPPFGCDSGDLDGDGTIGAADLAILLGAWGS